jgi:hypothetical protein
VAAVLVTQVAVVLAAIAALLWASFQVGVLQQKLGLQ